MVERCPDKTEAESSILSSRTKESIYSRNELAAVYKTEVLDPISFSFRYVRKMFSLFMFFAPFSIIRLF